MSNTTPEDEEARNVPGQPGHQSAPYDQGLPAEPIDAEPTNAESADAEPTDAQPAPSATGPDERNAPVPLIEPDEPATVEYAPDNIYRARPHDEPVEIHPRPTSPYHDAPRGAPGQPVYEASDAAPTSIYEQPAYDQQPAQDQPPVYDQPPAYAAAGQQPIYVHAPIAPTKKGNRGIGTLLAVLGTVIYGLVYAGVAALIILANNGSAGFGATFTQFLMSMVFWASIIGFAIILILIILIVNRASWWAYVLGGFLVAVGAYAATIGGAYLAVEGWNLAAAERTSFLNQVAFNPLTIAAGVVAREVTIWIGAWIAARGRTVKLRNAEAEAEYQRKLQAAPGYQPA